MSIRPGLAVIHANRVEDLRDLVVDWLRRHPLRPLETEVVWVQSNGMTQWLQLALADSGGLGISAAISPQLPARFLWSAYRAVLGPGQVPEESPFDKAKLVWRLFRLLPECLADDRFAPLRHFLDGSGAEDAAARKRYQLARSLADLFDQYQVYRADWLMDWGRGEDRLGDGRGGFATVPAEQAWQPRLWREILADLPEDQRPFHRAALHERFIEALARADQRAEGLPRRIVVFGISSLPQQMLRALAGLARFVQIVLCVHDPCRHYWADLIEERGFFRFVVPDESAAGASPFDANPLLAAWGKQGRDYIRSLEVFDDRIDLFDDYGEEGNRTLLQQVQQAILEREPLPGCPEKAAVVPAADRSIVFHIAHSPQREVEILHDHLLALFAESGEAALAPRDVIVMVPDIHRYAPYIRAVFGSIDVGDPRYIPFSLADQRERGRNPLALAVEWLLHLPEARLTVTELLDLLEVPALRRRFGIDEEDLPKLHTWIEGSGIRWGLHAEQRSRLGLPQGFEQNSWRFGLARMLWGYAVGRGAAWQDPSAGGERAGEGPQRSPHGEIEPYDEVGGLEAALVGPLAALFETLDRHWRILAAPAQPCEWGDRLRRLLEDFFAPEDEEDLLILERLWESLERWEDACVEARLSEPLPLVVVREDWLAGLDEPGLSQRFLAGGVHFCTLLPMRAIPFPVVCLMGMNDGDYPRSQPPLDFDLMAGNPRPGDRSRREDDRYLFLEALLSARRQLYVSWVGRSVQDNGECPPSVLVAQLREYLAAGWRAEESDDSLQPCGSDPLPANGSQDPGQILLRRLTVEHPLQPFSPRYFLGPSACGHDPRLFTYAHEWRGIHDGGKTATEPAPLPPIERDAPLSLKILAGFLRRPVQSFFTERLRVRFDEEHAPAEDLEPFAFDGLQRFRLGSELLDSLAQADADWEEVTAECVARQRRRGELPMGAFAEKAMAEYLVPARATWQRAQELWREWQRVTGPVELRLQFSLPDGPTLLLEDWLGGLRSDGRGRLAWIGLRPQPVRQGNNVKWQVLVEPWVSHLAACAAGIELWSFLVGPEASFRFPPVPSELARARLDTLVAAWDAGMRWPLPLACKTAFVWLSKADDPDAALRAARQTYEGDSERFGGEVQEDSYLTRAYPDFARLTAPPSMTGLEGFPDGAKIQADRPAGGLGFFDWARLLYRPLFESVGPEGVSR
ncbi:MAG TPA: exodeoxyribonuclease V subunit gamma [Methylococcus sp.]|nr:exodeoxyribonuclease V subunit gamma [Methylococcus sp.]